MTPGREPLPPWAGRRVVLGVCGGIAAYKSVQVARDLTLRGATVDVVLTDAARRFVAPMSFEGVTGHGPLIDIFAVGDAALHVSLGREADCVCVAPATADFIARAASGRASDLLTTVLVATDAPVVIAPAMNDRMFAHPRTRASLAVLEEDLRYRRVGPAEGRLAAGEGSGPGRMVEPATIVDAVGRALGDGGPLAGSRVLVTAAGTREPVDPVRYLGNRSSGKMGYALARAAWLRGAEVTLVSGPSTVPVPYGVEMVRVETALEMCDAVLERVGGVDVAVHAAAVADYRPRVPRTEKVKRGVAGDALTVDLVANPDIAAASAARMKAGSVAVGFALETSELLTRARRKLDAKGFDLIVANRAGEKGAGFEIDTNRVTIIVRGEQPRELPVMDKFAVACEILDVVEERLA
ncbi:MAG: bifunctional phosphopantothenoylcysteine decarboxylase/phosphopantothenate--cysteine ligase CoaBC [Gemmatimonadetes bacterium]|nr:bifunctional phosphopantothenoylcysteine decarboxylase/phosphopantothenate--cysteine ligase CoaBC [Gemmatimonadota bacterium]MXX73648.1 bifunctional phosphopantothenoylcysteine decarboxylase/phosphopantothenate--cysteine ligase CoaBC [Gemmatimonadota bacterium]MYC91010.1 bifunctional phosphopantothenoylcysteine decarboxylase/phosphopantothenate--cysteine ligase CoaBC [Gemmatimonadota bacterium]MYG37271.1 bifunctional phosphopantothenoylcysteine decarboxylase/phosphopantothenate--cysteine liga